MRVLLKTALAGALAAALLGAAPTRVADPIALMHPLLGSWNCSSHGAARASSYTATYSYALGGRWLRSTNTAGTSTSEDLLTYLDRRWRLIDIEADGTASVLEAPDTGLAHIALRTQYPRSGPNVTFDRISWTKYTLTFTGAMNGKPARRQDICTKT